MVDSLRFPSLAQDLALVAVPGEPLATVPEVCKAYGITEDELKAILKIPQFQDFLRQALEGVRAKGDKAGIMYRSMALAQGVSEKLYRDFLNDDMKAGDAVKFLDLLYKVAGLMDNKSGPAVAIQNNVGVALPSPAGLANPKFSALLM